MRARMSEFYMTKVAHGGDRRYAQRNEGGRAHRCSATLSPSPRPSKRSGEWVSRNPETNWYPLKPTPASLNLQLHRPTMLG